MFTSSCRETVHDGLSCPVQQLSVDGDNDIVVNIFYDTYVLYFRNIFAVVCVTLALFDLPSHYLIGNVISGGALEPAAGSRLCT